MNILKKSIFGIAAIALASCGGGVPNIIETPAENIDKIPLKIAELSEEQLESWSYADLMKDTIPGMSVDRAYSELINGRNGQKVIVAVIDSGIDIEHPDLDGVIWTNPGEIAGNGKDDDNNGYIDDIHGWNFLCDAVHERLEKTRIVARYMDQFAGKTASQIPANMKDTFALYSKAKAELDNDLKEANDNKAYYTQLIGQFGGAHDAVSKKLGKEDYTVEEVQAIKTDDQSMQQAIGIVTQMFNFADSYADLKEQLQEGIDYFQGQLDYNYNVAFNGRVTGDDPNDWSDNSYGNANVMGPDPEKADTRHGTHVAGIIAAERNNGIGMNGVANNVEIMAVRAVPDGDEYDKDIALAIRYAVDNGAKVINSSFGKYYSENSQWVRDAIVYASKNDVLIVNAAGNEGTDLDTTNVYPNDQVDNGKEVGNTFLTVGALNHEYGSHLLANFSNYGEINVDVFAPGVDIYSTTPNNTYEYLGGTSMASPNTAGVAAMIRSYYPSLNAATVKQLIMKSGTPLTTTVILGGDENNTEKFNTTSMSGRMVNMYNAFVTAAQLSN